MATSHQVQFNLLLQEVNSGGTFDYPTFCNNPQIFISLQKTKNVTFSVRQAEYQTLLKIGFYVLRSDGTGYPLIDIKQEDVISKTDFIAKETIEKVIQLPASPIPYVLIPCTHQPALSAKLVVCINCPREQGDKPDVMKAEISRLGWKRISRKGEWNQDNTGCSPEDLLNNPIYHISANQNTRVCILVTQMGILEPIGMYIVNSLDVLNASLLIRNNSTEVSSFGWNRVSHATCSFTLNAGEKRMLILCTQRKSNSGAFELSICNTFGDLTVELAQVVDDSIMNSKLSKSAYRRADLGPTITKLPSAPRNINAAVKVATSSPKTSNRASLISTNPPHTISASWRGPTAGGNRAQPTYANNDQILLTVLRACKVIVTLKQKSTQHFIGFYVTKSTGHVKSLSEDDIAVGPFVPGEQTSCQFDVTAPSSFNIIPCTREANKEGDYEVLVLTDATETYHIKLEIISGSITPATRITGITRSTTSNLDAARNNSRAAATLRKTTTQSKLISKESEVVRKTADSDWSAQTLKRPTTSSSSLITFKQFKISGAWSAETAGGDITYPSFRNNPYFLVTVTTKCKVNFMLHFDDNSQSDLDFNQIKMYITLSDDQCRRQLLISKNDIVAITNSADQTFSYCEAELDPVKCPYILTPCTKYPGYEAVFHISALVDQKFNASVSLQAPQNNDLFSKSLNGAWKGSSAGGNSNYQTFRNNPNFALSISQKSELVVILSQSRDVNFPIGFYIATSNGNQIVASEFLRKQEVDLKINLERGEYNIIACTLEPNSEGDFTISVFSNTDILFETPTQKMKTMKRQPRVQSETLKKANLKRTRILVEVFQTEETYVSSLELLLTYYLEPLTKVLSREEHELIFETIKMIKAFNQEFLASLNAEKVKSEEELTIGSVFLKNCAFMKIYANYCISYPKAVQLIEQLNSNKKFTAAVESARVASNSPLQLRDFLIMPVQRIPRYVMLMQEIVKNTHETHIDYDDAQAALSKVKEIAEYLNDKKREAENKEKLQELEKKITALPPEIKIYHLSRKLYREGVIDCVVRGKKKTKKNAILFSDIVIICSSKYKFSDAVILNDANYTIDEITDGPNAFSIKLIDKKVITFSLATPAERNVWLADVKSLFS
eukprot:TRINITY_DN1201_c5_g1_i1.p1 TRINITY_DN1201_c5_g1~~TRINITY_DN1201_c5_g1_i1.p1  ORF type:complete len:1127 (-),score=499.92 TRINITY_DN1201_c5_g1_i1:73-3453(-)